MEDDKIYEVDNKRNSLFLIQLSYSIVHYRAPFDKASKNSRCQWGMGIGLFGL